MTTKLHNPHDRFFRRMMTDKRIAIGFFQQYLPQHIQLMLCFDDMVLCNQSFVGNELKLSAVDVLYATKFNGKPGYLYTLVEHQSTEDNRMPFRMLQYIVNIMQYHLDQYHTDVLPIVYPMVFAACKSPYKGPTDIFDCFGEYKTLAQETLLKPFQLVDAQQISDETLAHFTWSGTFTYLCKHIRTNTILNKLTDWVPQLLKIEQAGGGDVIISMLKYALSQDRSIRADDIVAIAERFPEEIGGKMRSVAEQLKEQGMQQGMQQGIRQEKQATARKMLSEAISTPVISKITGLTEAAIRALAADTVH